MKRKLKNETNFKNYRKVLISHPCTISPRLLGVGGQGTHDIHLCVPRCGTLWGLEQELINTCSIEANSDDFHGQGKYLLGMEEHSLLSESLHKIL